MKVIALTGGIGAGKSTVAAEFKKLGAELIDADEIGHELMRPGASAYQKVTAAFGNAILAADGEIDRKVLAALVFSDAQLLAKLNALTHGCILDEMQNRLFQMGSEAVVVLEVPLLFQCDFPLEYQLSIAVLAEDEVRIQRIIRRDQCTREAAVKRIRAQLSNAELKKRADICIENNNGLAALQDTVKNLYDRILHTDRSAKF